MTQYLINHRWVNTAWFPKLVEATREVEEPVTLSKEQFIDMLAKHYVKEGKTMGEVVQYIVDSHEKAFRQGIQAALDNIEKLK